MITIYDTTLRDGAQSSDVNLGARDKIELLKALDELGVDYIELGWPASNEKDMEVFLEASKLKLKNAKVVAFGSTKRFGIKAEEDSNLRAIINSKAKVACIFGKTWSDHIEKQLRITPEENLAVIEDSIKFLRKNKMQVFYDLEHFFDGYMDSKSYALRCIKTAANAGAEAIIMCDTNGGTLPEEIGRIVSEVTDFTKKNGIKSELGIHCHDDSGCGVANTLKAVSLGCTHVQGTINGFGERCGNANLCAIIPDLVLKMDAKLPKIKLSRLENTSSIAYTLANKRPNIHQPYVGKNAFAHKGGVHVDAVMKGASYEHINPELVGNKREIILSELSGRANVVEVSRKFGFDVDKKDPRAVEMLKEVELMEKRGYDIGSLDAEQYLLAQKYFGSKKEIFRISTWKVMSEQKNGEYSECVLTGFVDGKDRQVVAPVKGGPVDATFTALKKMIATNRKEIEKVKLINYKVMIAQDQGAESSVRVYIEFKNNGDEWGCVGVSANILEASLEAIRKGFTYFLWKS
ncbi:citramalate synthase [Candidatus Woesearchaeota archaeon]|nr:citramalate synthase [Candidatus Woesearchaeota archaeon]